MKIILLKNIKNIGLKGEEKSVSDGYARNFLFPQKLAVLADDKTLRQKRTQKIEEENKKTRELKTVGGLKKKLAGCVLNLSAKASESGTLFGSITKEKISEILKEKGIEVGAEKIKLSEPIKSVGSHGVEIRLAPDTEASISVKVEKKIE